MGSKGLILKEPVTIELGNSYQYRKSGSQHELSKNSDTFQYVPFIEYLTWCLQHRDLLQGFLFGRSMSLHATIFNHFQILEAHHKRNDGYLADFCDGQLIQSLPLFTEENLLQIVMYYDDVETCNPLGSYHGKHKLGLCARVYSHVHATYFFL